MSAWSSMPRRKPPPPPPPNPPPPSPGSRPRNWVAQTGSSWPPSGRPEADRVDAQAARRGLLGGFDRFGSEVVRPVGQGDDDVGRIRPGRDRWRFGARAVRAGAPLDRGIHLGDRVDGRQDAAADGRPAAGRQAAQRRDQGGRVVGRRLDDLGEPAERHDPDLGARALVLDECGGRILGRDQPGRLDVVRAHAARHVHDQDDGGLVGRDRGDGDRPADGEGRAPRAPPRTGRTAGDAASGPSPGGRRGRATGSSSGRRSGVVGGGSRRRRRPAAARREQEQQEARPQEGHGNRPARANEATAPATQEPEADRGEQPGQLDVLGPDHEGRVDLAVDRVERRGVVGAVVASRRCGRRSSAASRRRAGCGPGSRRGRGSRRSRCRSRPCRSGRPGRPRSPARLDRVGTLGVLAVGQQDDDGRGMRARRDRCARRRRLGRAVRCSSRRSDRLAARSMAASDASMPRASDVPRCGRNRPSAAMTASWSLVGCWTAIPESLNATTPTIDARRLLAHEVGGRRDRGRHPGRLRGPSRPCSPRCRRRG